VVGRCAADSCLYWLRVASCGARYFKGYFREEVIEDILLSERDGGGGCRDNGRASCGKRSEREQGREIIFKKVQVLIKILKNRAL